ncbi:putative reverse transcriptase domain-containing protein [Tanacetum coccineum]|uniref:Reverse transcriptase domain-containing protein n=1 Tax=Tanacetum coccineum TaxID=301880 RepID=A0ABQ5I0A4_9ASTR
MDRWEWTIHCNPSFSIWHCRVIPKLRAKFQSKWSPFEALLWRGRTTIGSPRSPDIPLPIKSGAQERIFKKKAKNDQTKHGMEKSKSIRSQKDPEEDPEEDVILLEDDAELIFPYEVEGDKTPPPGDVSSDSVSSDSESEDEEVDVAPEATVGTITQKPYAIRDFSRGLFEVGESSSARDSSHVDGLAPWALRRDLEASRARARVMEAELGTCQTEIALLKSKDKIREKERELLNHDLENVERALGNVLERMSVLESGENATLKKRLAETETKLVWARMECETAERRLHESRGAGAGGTGAVGTEVGGARPAAPKITGCTYITFMKCDLHPFKGTEDAVGLCQWFEKLESVFRISDCKKRDKVKFAAATLQGRALTWWNGRITSIGIDAANGTSWAENGESVSSVRLSKNICGDVTSSKPADIDEAVHPNDNEVYPKCKNKKHVGDCWKCGKCGKLGHKTAACWSLDRKDVTCFNCNEKGHRKRDCPKLKKNGQGGNNHGAVYKLGAVDAQQDPKVVTGTFLLNNRYATALFDSGADKSFVSTNFSTLIDIEPVELDT